MAESEIHEVLRAQILDGRALVGRVLRALRAVVLDAGEVDEQNHHVLVEVPELRTLDVGSRSGGPSS